ncbi:DUF4133 domain-containing protein [Capnocytophaga cynodegmi]|uniref:DUF4133 domain-containing protein n=1 Tax=Capnocytophaga cynodegmi TaxID=28189 RepID=UPI001ACC4A63|nr:DUF4133 domain-containing protein [Capnocytophaga cynodegmi]GIM54042.1 hypothetical protein CAPN005_06890 [Capnocytophaga cynodegmi]
METRKTYAINKGIGRSVEFKGLKAQYLFIFAGGLLAVLILVMILYTVGVQPYLCLGLGVGLASLVVWQTFSLNQKYGEYGLMKKAAGKRLPKYLRNQKSVRLFIRTISNTKN